MNAVRKSWLKALPFKIFVLAAAYFIVGLLTLAANIFPVIDTVVWLPAGIALTAILVWGYRVWPGILLGAFGAQAVVHLDLTSGGSLFMTLVFSVFSGLGAVLQGFIGAYLILRFGGFPRSLNRLREANILLFGGPVSCLVGAVVSGTVSMFVGSTYTLSLIGHWWNWWVAETLGVLIVLPLVSVSRNLPDNLKTILANCLTHARRNFVDVLASFPQRCQYVIEILGKVYKNDQVSKVDQMTDQQRLQYHQTHSGPLMQQLEDWLDAQLNEKKTEPNSGLGKAIAYMQNHWPALTLFLRVPGAPLDNNLCEQVLKRAILHRKNSLFFKTERGAFVGDLFMSLIHTCSLVKANPFDYLTAIQEHCSLVRKNPQNWMPWNYRAALPESDE